MLQAKLVQLLTVLLKLHGSCVVSKRHMLMSTGPFWNSILVTKCSTAVSTEKLWLKYVVVSQEAFEITQALEASLVTYAEQVAHASSPTSLAVSHLLN